MEDPIQALFVYYRSHPPIIFCFQSQQSNAIRTKRYRYVSS